MITAGDRQENQRWQEGSSDRLHVLRMSRAASMVITLLVVLPSLLKLPSDFGEKSTYLLELLTAVFIHSKIIHAIFPAEVTLEASKQTLLKSFIHMYIKKLFSC